jgi:hypothetical protein
VKAALTGIMLTPGVVCAGPEDMASEVCKIANAMLAKMDKDVTK